MSISRCLYNKVRVRYFRGFCVLVVGGAYVYNVMQYWLVPTLARVGSIPTMSNPIFFILFYNICFWQYGGHIGGHIGGPKYGSIFGFQIRVPNRGP
jgi:hypothetical protein